MKYFIHDSNTGAAREVNETYMRLELGETLFHRMRESGSLCCGTSVYEAQSEDDDPMPPATCPTCGKVIMLLLLLALTMDASAAPISLDLNPVKHRNYPARVPDGHYGVRAHGTGAFVLDGLGRTLDERALVRWIMRDPRYRAGQPVYLLCCHTGRRNLFGQCFAQRLANLLRCPVTAPTTQVWVFPDGSHRVCGGYGKPDHSRPGSMETFYPKSR